MTPSTRSLRYQEITTVEPHVTFSYTDDKRNFAGNVFIEPNPLQ